VRSRPEQTFDFRNPDYGPIFQAQDPVVILAVFLIFAFAVIGYVLLVPA
jgi:hypothetical protein